VGRFLEHSRIFWFHNGGEPQIYLGSADWRPRNLDRRVEVLFPVEAPALAHRITHEILGTILADTAQAREMQPDGTYRRLAPVDGRAPVDSQAHFLYQAQPRVTKLIAVGDPHAVVTIPVEASRNANRDKPQSDEVSG